MLVHCWKSLQGFNHEMTRSDSIFRVTILDAVRKWNTGHNGMQRNQSGGRRSNPEERRWRLGSK